MPLVLKTALSALEAYFVAQGRRETYQKGELIMQGDVTPTAVRYIQDGFVKGYSISDEGTRSLLIIKGKGDLIPLASLFAQTDNLPYYEALTDMVVRRLPKRAFESDLQQSPALALAVLKKSLSVLRDYTQRLDNLEVADARRRVVCRLLFLRERFGVHRVAGHQLLTVPVTYPDLADSLNLTRETANRIVRQLVAEGLVYKSHSGVAILDKQRLLTELQGICGLPKSS